jgi:hypothetical protein
MAVVYLNFMYIDILVLFHIVKNSFCLVVTFSQKKKRIKKKNKIVDKMFHLLFCNIFQAYNILIWAGQYSFIKVHRLITATFESVFSKLTKINELKSNLIFLSSLWIQCLIIFIRNSIVKVT